MSCKKIRMEQHKRTSLPPNLKPEVLVKIISYLSLSDRKNARLVARSWYKASTQKSIAEKEKFIMLAEQNVKHFFKVLSKSSHTCLNIEFFGTNIDHSSILFWKKNGHRILNLVFINCQFKKNAARKIMKYCTEVQHMTFERCKGFFSIDNFEHSCKNKIIRNKLQSINIKYDDHINDYLFNKIFEIYPRVKNIGMCLKNDRSYNYTYNHEYFKQNVNMTSTQVNYESKQIFSHGAVYNKFKFDSSTLEGIKYKEVDKDVGKMHNNLIQTVSRIPNLKLKKFQFDPSSFNIPSETALKFFFSNQPNLEIVKLKKINFSNDSFEHLLRYCLKMTHLELVDVNNVDIRSFESIPILLNYELINKFASSNLKVLKLHFDFHFEEHDFFHSRPIPKKTKLKHLSINSKTIFQREILFFLETFQQLTCLNLSNSNVDDTVMQVILKYQVNLVSLVLRFNDGITDFGLTGRPLKEESRVFTDKMYSISRLQRLENLDLTDCKHITKMTLLELVLPELKYLSLSNCNQVSDDGVLSLIKNCPVLEYLDISHTSVSSKILKTICSAMNRLHLLDATFCDIEDVSMKCILKSSKSLRFFNHTSNTYYFDIYKRKWNTTNISIWLEINNKNVRKYYSFPLERRSDLKNFIGL